MRDCQNTSGKILMIVHQQTSVPGRIGQALRARGLTLDIRRPRFGDALPDTMDEHLGAVVFGGPMSANDDEDYIAREIDWLNVPLRDEAPLLGVCLGAQLLVRALGGTVCQHEGAHAEVGYYPLFPTPEGRKVCDWPDHVYQWHREGFTLPESATRLAGSELYPNQAFSYGPAALAIQFHPEITLAMMHRWTVSGAERLSLPSARPRDAHFIDRARHDGAIQHWLDGFLHCWLARGGDAQARRPARRG